MKQIAIIPAVFTIVLILAGCSSKPEQGKTEDGIPSDSSNEKKVEMVRIMELKKQVIGRSIEQTSTLMPFEEVHLAPSSPGRVEKIYVEIGSIVSKGDVLVQMDRTQLHQAMVQLNTVETDFKRLDTLNKVGSISKQQYDQAKAQYEIALSNVEYLKENTRLIAPFSGVISGKYFEDGELYSGAPNTTAGKAAIVSIVQMNPLKAIVSISENYFPMFSTGMIVQVESDIYPDKEFRGKVFRIHPTIDQATRSFEIEVEVPNPGEKLRPGMFCRVSIEIGVVKALVVPAVAILKLQGSNERYVFLEENGKARRISVTLGKRYDDQVEITSRDIKEGDHLIVSGQSRLLDGIKVKVVPE
ncbi:MAG: efflux RND transporter periplasmic adaptor subunit [Bacteroidales bacterium]|jgi:membrane fusion protein (multidrug efflux system)|nr:efflux RND transporter periplasmic adaptor subunit [Bacteroidales bacterium]